MVIPTLRETTGQSIQTFYESADRQLVALDVRGAYFILLVDVTRA
jgi:hypothetical protein